MSIGDSSHEFERVAVANETMSLLRQRRGDAGHTLLMLQHCMLKGMGIHSRTHGEGMRHHVPRQAVPSRELRM